MGTRADFYVGRGVDAEWLGSVAFDGYPFEEMHGLMFAMSEAAFREAVDAVLSYRDDATHPEDGWPWPWDDSQTTDYAYAFDGGQTWVACFGHGWLDAADAAGNEREFPEGPKVSFPNMTSRQAVTFGRR